MTAAVSHAPDWEQWVGEIVAGEVPLGDFLGKGERSGVFRTRYDSAPAAIKLVPATEPQAQVLADSGTTLAN